MHGWSMRGGRCVPNASTPADPSLIPGTNGSWSSGARGGAADGGGGGRSVRASAPAAGASPALRVLAAISAQRGAACAAFTDGHADPQFTRSVKLARVSTPVIAAGPGLDAAWRPRSSKLARRRRARVGADRRRGDRVRALARRRRSPPQRRASPAAGVRALREAGGDDAGDRRPAARRRGGGDEDGRHPEVVVTAAAVSAFQRRVRTAACQPISGRGSRPSGSAPTTWRGCGPASSPDRARRRLGRRAGPGRPA